MSYLDTPNPEATVHDGVNHQRVSAPGNDDPSNHLLNPPCVDSESEFSNMPALVAETDLECDDGPPGNELESTQDQRLPLLSTVAANRKSEESTSGPRSSLDSPTVKISTGGSGLCRETSSDPSLASSVTAMEQALPCLLLAGSLLAAPLVPLRWLAAPPVPLR